MSTPTPRFLIEQYDFGDIHAQIGNRVQLEMPPRSGAHHDGTLLGFALGESVLIKTPIVNGLPLAVAEDTKSTVRAFTGRSLFTFDSAVQRVCLALFRRYAPARPGHGARARRPLVPP